MREHGGQRGQAGPGSARWSDSAAGLAAVVVSVVAVLPTLAGCDQALGLERPHTCPASYTTLSTGTYQKLDELTTWADAALACKDLRDPETSNMTHLAVIGSDEELRQIRITYPATELWIGLTDLAVEGTFVPITDEVTGWPAPGLAAGTPPWAPSQPNNLDGDQNCLSLDVNTKLDDKACNSPNALYHPLCECDLFPAP